MKNKDVYNKRPLKGYLQCASAIAFTIGAVCFFTVCPPSYFFLGFCNIILAISQFILAYNVLKKVIN